MKRFKHTYWILGLFLLTSCTFLNQKETVIMGMVFDQSTEQPVSGLTINLHNEVSSLESFSSVGGGIVASTTTDENGWYNFTLDLDTRAKNYYTVEADLIGERFFVHGWNFGDYIPTEAHAYVEPGSVQHINMPLVSYGELIVTATNTSEQDRLQFRLMMEIEGAELTGFYYSIGAGQSYKQPQPVLVPQGEVAFNWHITGDDIDTNIFFMQTITQEDSNYIVFNFEG